MIGSYRLKEQSVEPKSDVMVNPNVAIISHAQNDGKEIQFTNLSEDGMRERGSSSNSSVTSTAGVALSFHDIWYQVEQRSSDKLFAKKQPKDILKGVSGFFSPGVNAIMGPTGSGKTSLLDILAMRKDPAGLKKGTVLINGSTRPGNFRLLNGYVVQDDDIVMGTLSVRENITFSANLRLSKEKFSEDEIKKKVEKVIKQLGLEDCANTPVGTEFIRGVSGGERKRVNIGMELIIDPQILFLDEPTTGLDANTASSIVYLLHNLAKEDNRTLILSIHQPRYSIFELFDKLLILRKGEIVFTGATKSAIDHFRNIGFPCPRYHNPADFFLDIVGSDGKTKKLLRRIKSRQSQLSLKASLKRKENIEDEEGEGDIGDLEADLEGEAFAQHLIKEFQNSDIGKEEHRKVENYLKIHEDMRLSDASLENLEFSHGTGYETSFGHQLSVLSQRTVVNIIRDPIASIAHISMVIFFSFLIGLVYFQVPMTLPDAVQNRAGCFFFLVLAQVTMNLSALETFIAKRKHFIHESASGYYRVSVYFISQCVADLIPYRIIPQILCALIVYWMVGFQPGADKFFFFTLAQILTCLAASAICFIVSASTDHFAIANIMVAIPYTIMLIFGGFLVNTSSMLVWLRWLKWLSIFRYGINALSVNEMTGLVFIGNTSFPGFDSTSPTPCISTITHLPIPGCMTGEQYMDSQDIPYGVWGMWQNIVALTVIFIVLMASSYVQLRRVPKYK